MSTILHSSTHGCFRTSRSVAPCTSLQERGEERGECFVLSGEEEAKEREKTVCLFVCGQSSFRKNKDLIDCRMARGPRESPRCLPERAPGASP
jgi:hypothetical protein